MQRIALLTATHRSNPLHNERPVQASSHDDPRLGHNGGASRGVRSPYPRPAPVGAGSAGRGPADSSGPGVPNEESFRRRPRRRKREPDQRGHRTHPRFSDTEWAAINAAARANHCQPGTFTALATVLAAGHDDPRAAVADFRTGIQRLHEATTALARVGNLLNQTVRHLHQGGQPHTDHQRLLDRLQEAIDHVEDTAVHLVREPS